MSLVRRLIRQFLSQARLLRLVRANSDITPLSSSVRIAGNPTGTDSDLELVFVVGAMLLASVLKRVLCDTICKQGEVGAMIKAGHSTPMLRVRDVGRSIRFYELIGFSLIDSEGSPPGWARLHCTGGAIMLLADLPFDVVVAASRQMFSLSMYVSDLPALCEQLQVNGVLVPAIIYPPYMPSGEIRLTDPDGYAVSIYHWAREQQNAWEMRVGAESQHANLGLLSWAKIP